MTLFEPNAALIDHHALAKRRTKPSQADKIRRYLLERVRLARKGGNRTIRFRSGDVAKALGLQPRLANVCQVLKGAKFHEQAYVSIRKVISSPPSGMGANLVVEFEIH